MAKQKKPAAKPKAKPRLRKAGNAKQDWSKALMKHLQTQLKDRIFFANLPMAVVSPFSSRKVKKLVFRGRTVVIKDTLGKIEHGFSYKSMRKKFLAHHKALKSGEIKAEHYKLRSAAIYGTVGNYLIMEFVPQKLGKDMTKAEYTSWKIADLELCHNLQTLFRDIDGRPQALHIMPVRNTNPKNYAKGKWLVYLPYDYNPKY